MLWLFCRGSERIPGKRLRGGLEEVDEAEHAQPAQVRPGAVEHEEVQVERDDGRH